jgi:thiamine-monophosphate kinase
VNELDLIHLLTRSLPGNASVITGAGDDCAVLDLGVPGQFVLFKTDAVVEGVHFTRETKPERIGHKALARCLSDIAAMAGTPTAALVTLGLPRQFDPAWIEAIYTGMNALAQRCGVAMVGGETTTNPERILISMALLGTVAREKCILRSGAKPGDGIFVTGELGRSLITGKHLDFEPRLAEARWLVDHFEVHAMIDLSDGLAGDLPHVLHASHAGAELLAPAIPVKKRTLGEMDPAWELKTPLNAALSDGEDFELLFTVPSAQAVSLLDAWKKEFPKLRLTCIGKITAEPGLRVRDRRGVEPLNAHGYVHFQEP